MPYDPANDPALAQLMNDPAFARSMNDPTFRAKLAALRQSQQQQIAIVEGHHKEAMALRLARKQPSRPSKFIDKSGMRATGMS
jgi:hypothetical protein